MNLVAVVLAGGSGTRFWPASRRSRPKQLLPLAPGSSEPLIAETVRRLTPLCGPHAVLVATGKALLDATRAALPQLPETAFLGEPVARNTAPCIGWAAAHIARTDPDAVVMVLPSDQHVGDEAAFLGALQRAAASAAGGAITTVGLKPTRPETGYGYIEVGDEVKAGVCQVARFVEKPDRATAEGYLRSGRYLWNSGMFFFRAGDMLAAIERHLPRLAAALQVYRRADSAELPAIVERLFAEAESLSIDHGVMEHEARLHVVPAEFGWSDLGSWATAWELAPQDADGNVAPDDAVLVDARRNLVTDLRTTKDGKVIAVVGVDDLCIVETDDALLVIPRARCQDVRQVVAQLKATGKDDRV